MEPATTTGNQSCYGSHMSDRSHSDAELGKIMRKPFTDPLHNTLVKRNQKRRSPRRQFLSESSLRTPECDEATALLDVRCGPPCPSKQPPVEQFLSGHADLTGTGAACVSYASSSPAGSCHTVCKEYDHEAATVGVSQGIRRTAGAKDFVSWCQDQGVRLLVRVNHFHEPGLPKGAGSYDAEAFFGLEHLHLPVEDSGGGVPSPVAIRRFLDVCEHHGASAFGSAVLVHCKGGFGRSVLFACCLLIHWHDISGRAVLGWSRIVRPGAIVTKEQEHFLCRLKDRGDLEVYLLRGMSRCGTLARGCATQ